jgi:two-component system CheB/CheR fusion protein
MPTMPDVEPESIDIASGIPVVGMGGSAGSLEAFKTFFTAMSDDSGAAFVVIQHLAPTHESLLPELLAQHTCMRVVQARDQARVEANCVYVIPPNQYLEIREGVLHLVEPIKHGGIRMPIDFFFRSLAEDRQERAICIVFSGAGSDGDPGGAGSPWRRRAGHRAGPADGPIWRHASQCGRHRAGGFRSFTEPYA